MSELNYAQIEDRSQATKLPTQAEDRDRDSFKSRFKEHPVPSAGIILHIIAGDAGVTQRSAHKRSLHLRSHDHRRCGCHSEISVQAFSAVLDHVVSMRDRERARDDNVNILSLRTLRVFSRTTIKRQILPQRV